MFIHPIGGKALETADRHRAFQLPPVAFLFTGMVADSAYRSWKGIILFDHIEGLFVPASLDQGNIALGARLCWTGMFAGARAPFGDKKGVRNSLRIRPVNGLSLIQSLIKFIWKKDRADLCAVITAGALRHIHIPR